MGLTSWIVCFLLLLLIDISIGDIPPTTQIIRSYGYVCEDHLAPTEDGWKLSLQRIPHGKQNTKTKGSVLFVHGLTDASVGVVLNNPSEGLPFILADAGFDVWLGNNRGNGYSMDNTKYNPNQDQFWDFTYDEMAQYDLPAMINYVLSVSSHQKLTYIGHSEGTIQAFAGFLDPNFNVTQKVNLFIALAPVAYVGNLGAILLKVLADFDADIIMEILGQQEFDLPNAIQQFLPDICTWFPKMCEFDLNLIMGPSTNLNQSRIAYYLTYEPNPTSVKNVIHWSQGVVTKSFQKYDYGYDGNMKHYSQPTPPQYELQYFPQDLPLALFTGSNDYLADPLDVQLLLQQLPMKPYYYHNEHSYAHVDFIWAPDACTLIYPQIVSLINKVQQEMKL